MEDELDPTLTLDTNRPKSKENVVGLPGVHAEVWNFNRDIRLVGESITQLSQIPSK